MTNFFNQDDKRIYIYWTKNILEFLMEKKELMERGVIILEEKRSAGFHKLMYWKSNS